LLTWQELAAALPKSLQKFLAAKYGIIRHHALNPVTPSAGIAGIPGARRLISD
jgi:hypothetical protein